MLPAGHQQTSWIPAVHGQLPGSLTDPRPPLWMSNPYWKSSPELPPAAGPFLGKGGSNNSLDEGAQALTVIKCLFTWSIPGWGCPNLGHTLWGPRCPQLHPAHPSLLLWFSHPSPFWATRTFRYHHTTAPLGANTPCETQPCSAPGTGPGGHVSCQAATAARPCDTRRAPAPALTLTPLSPLPRAKGTSVWVYCKPRYVSVIVMGC